MVVTKYTQRKVCKLLEKTSLHSYVTGNHKHCTVAYQHSSPTVSIMAPFSTKLLFPKFLSVLNLRLWGKVYGVFSGCSHTAFKSLQ